MFKTILVPVDLEHLDYSKEVLRVASGLARQDGSAVHVLNVIYGAPAFVSQFLPKDYEAQASREARARLEAVVGVIDFGDPVTCTVRHGDIYPEILDYAGRIGADLIVMDSHRPGVRDYLLGSTAARVVRHADCSVFVVRH